VDFTIPAEIQSTLDQLDEFIEREIKPLEQTDDNMRFLDHRREWARTDFGHISDACGRAAKQLRGLKKD
jgi:butyryl-CoA dehydrogenase